MGDLAPPVGASNRGAAALSHGGARSCVPGMGIAPAFRRIARVATAGMLVIAIIAPGWILCADAIETGSGLEVAEPETVRVMIDDLSEAATAFGITTEGLEERVKARLMLKGLKPGENKTAVLVLKVNVGGPVFGVTAGFYRNVTYSVSGGRSTRGQDLLGGTAAVWTREMFGTHGGQRAWLYSAVDEIVDLFLREYRIANKPRLVSE